MQDNDQLNVRGGSIGLSNGSPDPRKNCAVNWPGIQILSPISIFVLIILEIVVELIGFMQYQSLLSSKIGKVIWKAILPLISILTLSGDEI